MISSKPWYRFFEHCTKSCYFYLINRKKKREASYFRFLWRNLSWLDGKVALHNKQDHQRVRGRDKVFNISKYPIYLQFIFRCSVWYQRFILKNCRHFFASLWIMFFTYQTFDESDKNKSSFARNPSGPERFRCIERFRCRIFNI